ncbi:hypothetical protein AGMMS49992_14960 [Clostridia bacterium]|nr:hypothetical protein AGMMS49992_14960 [Clostridia bacterium]
MRMICRIMRVAAAAVLMLGLWMSAGAAADVYVFPQAGLRLDVLDGETVLTPQSLDTLSDFVGANGLDADALRSAYYAERTLFEVFRVDGVRVTLSAREWSGDGAALESLAAFADSYNWIDDVWLRMENAYESIIQVTDAAIIDGGLIELTARAEPSMGMDVLRGALDSVKARINWIDKQQPQAVPSSDYIPTPLTGIARTLETGGTLALDIVRLPSWTADGYISTNGKTQPGAWIELAVDGERIAVTRADTDGVFAFEFNIDGADGEHRVQFVATYGGESVRRAHAVLLARGGTPLAVVPSMYPVTGSFDLYVYTLPDAAIELVTPSSLMHGRANTAGYLYFSLSIRRGSTADYKVTAQKEGFASSVVELSIERELTEIERVQEFRAYVVNIPYKRLLENSGSDAGRYTEMRGRIEWVGEQDGLPVLVVNITNAAAGDWRDPVFVRCDTLLQFGVGDTLGLLGVVRGELTTVEGTEMPVLDGKFYLR